MSFVANGTTLTMNRGDYGIPVPILVKSHCAACDDALLDDDAILLEVTKGDKVFVCRRETWGDIQDNGGCMTLELTQEESKAMCLGVYSWRLLWLRDGNLQNCILRALLEVVV